MLLENTAVVPADPSAGPWYKEMTRYHWFVFVVCAVGWLAGIVWTSRLFTHARASANRQSCATRKWTANFTPAWQP